MKNLAEFFLKSESLFPNNNALFVNDKYYSYKQILQYSIKIYEIINKINCERVCLFSDRNEYAYMSILAIFLADKAYIPFNPKAPSDRQSEMLKFSDSSIIVISPSNELVAFEYFSNYHKQTTFILFESCNIKKWESLNNYHTVINIKLNSELKIDYPIEIFSKLNWKNKDACLLFTSGTTSKPKGVMLSHNNIITYIEHTILRYKINHNDRISQVTELTFDFSIQDIWIAWSTGACVYAFPENYFLGFPNFILENKITIMTTVPSTIRLLHQFNKLKDNTFPSLRVNIFGGEPLTDSQAKIWQNAAPNSMIENVCGPTEATIAFTSYSWNISKIKNRNCIPIGKPLPLQKIMIVNENLNQVRNNEIGELLLNGDQVSSGYWKNSELTSKKFIKIKNNKSEYEVWYRTGDLVQWDEEDGLYFKGRIDDQIKIRGYRVECLEVENTLRDISGSECVAVCPIYSENNGVVESLIAFISHSNFIEAEIKNKCYEKLPEYMVPKRIYHIENIPLNINGKTDYLKLKKLIN
jgi:amino acid adenylation domain-containing protein